MKIAKSNLFLFFFTAIFLFGGCTPSTNNPAQPVLTTSPTTAPTPQINQADIEISGYQPITPDNIQNIELIKEIGSGMANDVALSPDGSLIAILTLNNIMVYDRDTYQKYFSFPIHGAMNSYFSFSPDSRQIVFTTHGIVSFLEVASQEISNSFSLTDTYGLINEISFTPDMNRLIIEGDKAVANCEGYSPSYALYTLDGTVLFERHGCGFQPYHFHKALNNSQTLFGISYLYINEPYKIYVVDNKSGNVLASFINHYDPDKEELVETITGNPAQYFTMDQFNEWATENRSSSISLTPSKCFVDEIPFSSTNLLSIEESYALLAFNRYSSIAITEFNMNTCEFTPKILYASMAYSNGEFSPDDKFFIYSNSYGINLLNLETDRLTYQEVLDVQIFHHSEYEFNIDGSRLLIGPKRLIAYNKDVHYEEMPIHIINPSTGKILRDIIPGGNDLYIITATLNLDIMMLKYEDRYSLWNIETGKYISSIPTGDYLFDASRNGIWILKPFKNNAHIVSLYDLSTGKLVKELDILHRSSQAGMSLLENDSVLNVSYTYDHSRKCNIQLNIEDGTVSSQECSEEPDDEPSPKNQSTEYTDWIFRNYSPQNYILFRDNYGYNMEDQISDFDPFIITRDLTFWDKNSGDYLGQLETNYWSMKTSFSANHYFLVTWGDDYIIRIYAIPEEPSTP